MLSFRNIIQRGLNIVESDNRQETQTKDQYSILEYMAVVECLRNGASVVLYKA